MRVTGALIQVLRMLMKAPSYGAEITAATQLKSGTVYPLLERLEREGLVRGEWERERPAEIGRPLRLIYELTADGRRESVAIFKAHGIGETPCA